MVDNYYGAHTHDQHEDDPEAPQSHDPHPWNAQDPVHDLEHSRRQKHRALSRDLLAIDNVLETGNDPSQPTIPPTTSFSFLLDQILSPEHLKRLREGVRGNYICLICTIQPPGGLPIKKSGDVTKNSKEFWDTKALLRQHINRKHLPCLTNKNFKFRLVCRKVFGVKTDLTKHNKVCAKECRAPDKPTIEALQKLKDNVNSDRTMNAYALAQHQLPLLFFQVDQKVVKRYDAKDRTNNLNLGSLTMDTTPCADEENLQALREAMKAVKDGYMGTQNVYAIINEVMGNDADAVPTAPSVQTQPLDTANELSLAGKLHGIASSSQAESINEGSFFGDQFDLANFPLEDPTVDGWIFENHGDTSMGNGW